MHPFWRLLMTTTMKGFGAAALLAAMSIAMAPQAQAQRSTCAECNRPATKVNTNYKYKTVQRVRNVTQYKDVNRTNYQKHVRRIVNVTRIQPVTRVNVVTRVHNRTVVLHQTQSVAQTATLPTRR
jgi:hypothetical protein